MRTLSFSFLIVSFALCSSNLEAQFAGTVPGTDQVSGTLTLKQAVDIAIKNNLVVNGADLTAQGQKINYDQAWENMLPTLNGNIGQNLQWGRNVSAVTNSYATSQNESGSAGLNASVPLFRGLQFQNNLKAQRYGYNAAKMDIQSQKDAITLSTLSSYLNVLNNQDQLRLAMEQSAVDSVQLGRLQALGREGVLNPVSNLTDLQGQYANDLINISMAINTLENSKVQLFNLLNIPYVRDIHYENNITASDIGDYPVAPDTVFQSALTWVPQVQSTQLKVQQYRKLLSAYRGAYFPTVSLNASIGTAWTNSPGALTSTPVDSIFQPVGLYNANGSKANLNQYEITRSINTYPDWWYQFKNNRGEAVGVSINIPILNGFQARNNVRQAKINLKNAQLNDANSRNILQQNVETAFQNMIAAYKNYKSYVDAAKAFEESFRIQNIRFTEGVIASDAYILAKGRSDQAEVNLAAAKYIYIFRTKLMDYYNRRLHID
jgi:outer membrane protein